ncbi:PH domain-containing protein [Paramicrobacterium agarici]|uniref:Putative membrane protein n=1 Tax=Paramicrobacterium agarici TaxID=630514 RepID=A0A2A9DVT9_9MICO|nr:PH domain-containing protein [Microbacterium agarici]PFG30476.1 putative membrane protein [Microbacterium agarici]
MSDQHPAPHDAPGHGERQEQGPAGAGTSAGASAEQHPDASVEAAAKTLTSDTLADGEWHRLHPATPLLRGGLILIAVLGYVIANMRERLITLFVGNDELREYEGDPIDWILRENLVGWALIGLAVLLVLLVVGFYLSWRMHTFRVTHEAVEVRSGILFRRHRRAALDRIQGINITRSFIPRLVGAAKLQVSVAGQGASVELSYLGSVRTDDLRRDILRLASGAKGETPVSAPRQTGVDGFVTERVNEFLAPELDPELAEPESVVRIPPLRIAGSVVISDTTVFLILLVIGLVIGAIVGTPWVLFSIIPAFIGFLTYYWSRITKSMRYSIAATRHGIRVGYGLLSTSNETIPPGRIHGIEVRQPLLWRPFGWWEIRINTAVQDSPASNQSQAQQRATLMPVGTIDDVERVLALVLPGISPEESADLVARGLLGTGPDRDFVTAPKASWIFNPLTWRRVGYALLGDVLITRQGFAHRRLVVIPLARIQSVKITQGPWQRRRGLASSQAHTVAGPVNASVGQLSRNDALGFFSRVNDAATYAANADTTQRWAATPE